MKWTRSRSAASPAPKNKVGRTGTGFSGAWFFLIFWLTVISTVLISWNMIIDR